MIGNGGEAPGKASTTRKPGALSSKRKAPPCRRATAAASDRPRPEPGRERAPSSRTKRPSTRRAVGRRDARPMIGDRDLDASPTRLHAERHVRRRGAGAATHRLLPLNAG